MTCKNRKNKIPDMSMSSRMKIVIELRFKLYHRILRELHLSQIKQSIHSRKKKEYKSVWCQLSLKMKNSQK